MADNRKSVNLLPDYLKSDKNSKFLSATVDPLIQSPQLERIDGFVGSRLTPNYNNTTDFYIKENSALRTNYSLEPALVLKEASSKITDVIAFDDLINEIDIQSGKTNNLDRLFRSKFYSYDPYINWDKLVNYSQYYWLPNGPDSIVINILPEDIEGLVSYTMQNGYPLSNGMKLRFDSNGNEYYVEGVGSSIKLINIKLLEVNELADVAYNETFDSDKFDSYPFDGDKKIPLTAEYITINRASTDLNPWSRYNRWFHSEIIRITSIINNQPFILPLNSRAQRPIVEFKPNIQLYNFGKTGIEKITVIDTDTTNAFSSVDGTIGYYVDGVLLEHGNTIIFNADTNDNVRGKIYTVNYDISTNPSTLRLVDPVTPNNLDSVAINYGTNNAGTCWHYNSATDKWIYSQQHIKINQAPLFDLFDHNGISYTDTVLYNSNFVGSKIFGYDIGTGTSDKILGFPLKYKNSVGVGSYLFKNYFMTDSINVSSSGVISTVPTSVTYFKFSDSGLLKNVWSIAVDYQIPVIEIQTILTATNIATISSISPTPNVSVIASVNSTLTTATLSKTDLTLTFDKPLNVNDVLSLKITSDQIPNSNGFYETPLGLTNNPLNGIIASFTLSELSDHLHSMVNRITNFSGSFPGLSNLRDLDDYSKYGTRLIINANPISFAQLFIGKKDHNVVDAIRHAADQYNQFKMNLLRAMVRVDSQLTPAEALDMILTDINNKSSGAPYYRSDMLGYGFNKIKRTYTVSNTNVTHYPIGLDFDLTTLSFKSVLVYINNIQLVNEVDYRFSVDEVIISLGLSLNDVIDIHYYPDTLGSFIPSTPSKLGLYPAYSPVIYYDESYISANTVLIRGHDGSVMQAYGDYRDNIILEYEKRVYNNIKTKYNSDIFDINAVIPGVYRKDKYQLSDANDILIKDFIKWTGAYGIDVSTNNIYDEGDPSTWNYKNSINKLTNTAISGHWRGIYKYFYDTDRPDIYPWEMLGHSSKPTWWDTHYSWVNPSKRSDLISAITIGWTEEPPSIKINANYARPDFPFMCPVDLLGNLLMPNEFLVSDTGYYDKISSWEFGDYGPAETAWRKSSYWPFALNAAAALLDPCTYTSSMFDTSRTELNSNGQLTYKVDNAYLNPNKLLIEGYDNVQTAGFGIYVVEKGLQKDINYLSILKQDLTYINFNLFHKVGGFVSKDKLQVVIDSIDPLSHSPGAVLPPENYTLVLNVSNPIKSASISGVVIQKFNGKFIIKGYDKSKPYFNVLLPLKSSASGSLTVGGKSEEFTEWAGSITSSGLGAIDVTAPTPTTTRYYKQGQIVRYNNRYYRVKVGHATQPTFDSTLFYLLSELPMVGGSTVQKSSRFENNVTKISYGTSYSSIQEIYDILIGYGAYLESQGFIFDEFNTDLNEIVDWKYTGKEFLYWTTQNWADGNLITLSPFADYLKYAYNDSIVDNISTGDYEYSLLKADGKSFPIDKFRLSREDGVCVINTIDTLEGIFFATLNSVQKEHGMVLDNTTIFNDTIYEIDTGYKQQRIKLLGFRTAGWNGDLSSPGFVYDNVDITDWAPYTLYLPGKVVRYNGAYYESNSKVINNAIFDFNKWDKLNSKPESNLLSNFDYKIKQFEDFYSLDIDNFDISQQKLAQHLVGYTQRPYLNSIITDPIAQYKFYQGFIKEKGTKNAVDKLSKVGNFTNQGDISFNEEWAFRVGQYGSFVTYNEIEINLTEGTALENPYVVKFVNSNPLNANPLITYKLPSDLLLTPDEYISSSTFNTYPSTFSDNNIKLNTAGYVRADDVTATAYNKNSLLDIANNSLIQEGNTIWLGFLENGDWTVYRYSNQSAKIAGVYVSSPAIDITFTTDINHSLSVGDIISIVRFNDQVNGIHIVTAIPRLDQFTVASSLTTIANAELLSNGSLFKFEQARYNNLNELVNGDIVSKLNYGEKIWIDNGVGDKWQVYEKIQNLTVGSITTASSLVLNQQFGNSIYTQEDSNILLMSATGKYTNAPKYGNISVFYKIKNLLEKRFDYTLNNSFKVYCDDVLPNEFGYSLAYDTTKGLYIAGAPAASLIKAPLVSGVVVTSDGSGTPKSFNSEGLVKISSYDEIFNTEKTEAVLVSPYATNAATAEHARFGHSVYVNNVAYTASTILLVGAPGDIYSNNNYCGNVYAYKIDRFNYYKATRAQVIYALAANPLAPLYYGEQTILNWMLVGLTGFQQFHIDYRIAHPDEASIWDAQRAQDAVGIINTRVEVLAAYQNNIDAQLYPDEASIRYWMINGLGADLSTFNYSVIVENEKNPVQHQKNLIERNTVEKPAAIYINPHQSGISLNSHVALTTSSHYGSKIVGDTLGNFIAISAPYHIDSTTDRTGVVQVFNSQLNWVQTLYSPFENNEVFGNDMAVSSDGSYLFVSSTNTKVSENSRGKVAIYKLSGSGKIIISRRSSVLIAYAENLLAPLYPTEEEIQYWMYAGLGTNNSDFSSAVLNDRELNPGQAALNDQARAADILGIKSTRAAVLTAYRNNLDAPIYPDEASIRYWMINGLGSGVDGFTAEITAFNAANPDQYAANLAERAALLAPSPYLSTRFEVIYAFAANLLAPVFPSNAMILDWMTSGLSGFASGINSYRSAHLSEAANWDTDRANDETGIYGNPIINTRAEVISAYQSNLNANLYPTDTDIRYWMTVGLDRFGSKIKNDNTNFPEQYASYLQVRATDDPIATKAQVILKYASNLEAELYPSDTSINYWMVHGLTEFDSTNNITRNNDPALAASIDDARAVDARNTKSTRAEVITAYQNNVDAPLYPIEADIRRWMLAGITSNTFNSFNNSIISYNVLYPANYIKFLAQRDRENSNVDYKFDIHQIIVNPLIHSGLKFGTSISISKNNNNLAISAMGTNNSELLTFDKNSKNGKTTFDGGVTKFTANIPNSGIVYVYGNINGYFVQGETLSDPASLAGNGFGYAIAATNNNIFVSASSTISASRFFEFYKLDSNVNGLKLLREQSDLVDISTIDRLSLIDSFKEELVEYLDIIDPLKGKIAGIAEQELKYKSAFDPATYSIGTELTVVDNNTSWIDDHVGELWWDLSTAKYQWYEQGDDIFRRNNWGKLFPGSSIDVYEWVKSDLLPSEWAAQADTNDGLTKGISGQPKYPDNTVVSVKQLFNNVTGAFESVYFFWVKNKVTVPNVKNRRISSYQVSTIISDPVANGLKFAEILSADSIAFANVQPMLVGNRINANIAINSARSEIPRHTEWLLMSEGNDRRMPHPLLEKKLIDSLLGHDSLGNTVPSMELTYRNRYGTGIRPQQTLFKDRVKALRNQVDFANSILIKERITSNYNFNNLNSFDPVPDELSREYDLIVNSVEELNSINTQQFEQALLTCTVNNGKIISVDISTMGYGYTLPPLVTIAGLSGNDAVILTEIDSSGRVINAVISNPGTGYVVAPRLIVRPQTVIIKHHPLYGNRWTKHQFDYASPNTDREPWIIVKNQTYNTTLYWDYVDWASDSYSPYKDYKYVIEGVYGLSTLENIVVGDYIKINNIGDGRFVILERIADSEFGDFSPHYNFVYSEKGTIQISESIWKFSDKNVAYDDATLEETLYDQIPDIELYYILLALKEDIFINHLKVNWNKFFFAAVKYALTEQKLLDWAFKTSFINVVNSVGSLDQRPVYKLDNEQYFEDYIKEVKPYHTNIRTYTSKYSSLEENSTLSFTDFDSPLYYNTETNQFNVVNFNNGDLLSQQPWKSWVDNYTYCVGSIIVADAGTNYTQIPTVTISGGGMSVTSVATAEAYIRNGGVFQILVTHPGAGYTETPTITISGGGPYVTVTATVSVSLLNLTTRKNIIGLKFDRVGAQSEIGDINVYDKFVCSGKEDKFLLSLVANRNKTDIIPTLNGRLIFANDYKIEYYSELYNGYTKHYSRFVFLNYVPAKDQIFEIHYKKSIDYYTAVDRIDQFYTATTALSSLMSGVIYPNNIIQGLPFEYSTAWDTIQGNSKYDVSAWSDNISYYASAKLVKNVIAGTSTLYLSTITDIYPGQVINILNSTTNRVRADTVVVSVNTEAKSITISQPHYAIKTVKSTATNVGSDIVVTTAVPFNRNIVLGDTVTIVGISAKEFNGQYVIASTVDNNKFIVTAKSVLSTTSTINTYGDANATVSSILFNINTATVLINYINDTYLKLSNNTIVIDLMTRYDEIAKVKVLKDNVTAEMLTGDPLGSHPGSEYYHLTIDNETKNVIATFYQMSNSSYNLEVFVYGNTNIEFWKTDFNQSGLDSTLPGGHWNSGWNDFVGGAGVTFTSTSILSSTTGNIIDGDSFLNERSGYAPEECVAGHVLDSLGINVYTKEDNSYPTVLSGSFYIKAGATPSAIISVTDTQSAGMMVHYNGKILDRVANQDELSSSHEYYMVGNTIHLGPQTVSGRGGYTMITIGGNYSLLDSNMETIYPGDTPKVISLLSSINDVHGTYVLVDGVEISEITQADADAGAYGYVVGPYSSTNNRASVTVYDLSRGTHNIQAWFFESKYTKFNRVHEELLDAGTDQTMFELGFVPGNIEPVSAQVIVEIFDNTTSRKRLLPPWVSYYQISGNQLTFAIDNKHTRLPDTYSPNTVFVYANGVKLRPGFDYTLNAADSTITIIDKLLKKGDAVAVVGLIDYDYIIDGNILELTTPVSNVSIKVTSFTNHDKMLTKTERFNGALSRRFTLSFPTLSDDYVWVYVDGVPLTARDEFNILDDARTIEVSDLISVTTASSVVITTINPPSFGNIILGFRIFNDMFDKSHFKRLSAFHSTTLLQPLRHTDDVIVLADGNGIIPPNPIINKPGVVIIDGERIEFAEKNGNLLKRLRRSTLGTGPATFSNVGTQVFDQSSQQTIPYSEITLVQSTSTTSTTYIINTVTTTATGAGIVLDPSINAVDQVTVYYGGRQLRKSPVIVHDKFYDKPVYAPAARTAYILIVGQSNIGNYGEHTDNYIPNIKVKRLDINGLWEPAVSPAGPDRLATGYNWASGSAIDVPGGVSGGNMDGRIGDILLNSGEYDEVYIVNVSVGGTELGWWLSTALSSDYNGGTPRGEDNFSYTNNKLYERLQFAVNKSNDKGFKFTHVLLGIGESDSINFISSANYFDHFSKFKTDIRNLGIDAPIYISKTSYVSYLDGALISTRSELIECQQNIINEYSDVYFGAYTDQYGDNYRWDHLHFKIAGLNAVASDWGNSIITAITSFNPNAPEFSINTATNELSLNISDYNGISTNITIVQRKGHIWTGTESLLTSNSIQAEFLRDRKSTLPDIYYYGGDTVIRDNNNSIITDDNNQPLEGY